MQQCRKLNCWHEQYSYDVQTDKQHRNMICPICGGDTEYINVTVYENNKSW